MGWHSFWGHFCTITRHRHTVMRHCRRAGIFWQGLRHDLSKYSPTEFWQGVRYYQDGKRSPNEAEREALGYSLAWMHHKGRTVTISSTGRTITPNQATGTGGNAGAVSGGDVL